MADHPVTVGSASSGTASHLRLVQRFQQAVQQFDRAVLVETIGELAGQRAPMGAQWQAVAQIAANIGELTLARKAMDQLMDASGGGAAANYHKAAFLAHIGATQEAWELLSELPDTIPDPASNAYSRGTTLLALGRVEEARDHLLRVTEMRPQSGSAWFALSQAAERSGDEMFGNRIVDAEKGMASAFPSERAAYCYALGRVHAGRGEHARAFAAFSQGAKIQKSLAAYDRDADRQGAKAAVNGFEPDAIKALSLKQPEATGRTLFINGLPRSGTTLVEQVLTSHSAVSGGGELNRLELLARETGGPSLASIESHVRSHGAGKVAQLWSHWMQERFPAPGHVVDKTVNTSRYLGMVSAMLPDARIIWVTRDPLDRAWSCFRTYFLGTMPWSYDLEDIAFHFQLDDWLLGQWKAILGERILVVPYEGLVTDFQSWVRRILSHCGLPEEDGVYSPHTNERAVTTASVLQVRRPVNRDAIGTAEPYREFMEPFSKAYLGGISL